VLELNEILGKTLAEAERLGNDGKVEESLQLMEKVDMLKKQKIVADVCFEYNALQGIWNKIKYFLKFKIM